MKKYWHIVLMLFCILGTISCSKDDDEVIVDEAWKLENEAYFQALAMNPDYREIKSQGNDGSIYYQILEKGNGKDSIYYTSQVDVYYKGTLIDGTQFDAKTFEDGAPFKCAVSPGVATNIYGSVIEGWTVALQHMVKGDKWKIVIPQQLGYGPTGNTGGTIKPYTTLIFEIQVDKVIQVP